MTSKIVSNFLEKATFSVQYYHFPGGSEIFREKHRILYKTTTY